MAMHEHSEMTAQVNGWNDTGFFGHPRGLRVLFFTEMWERFSFYGVKALLVLFMSLAVAEGGMGFDDTRSGMILAIYSSLVYFSNLPGGWIADQWLGQRRSVFLGGLIIMSGHICMTIHAPATFYTGLGLIVVGTGLLKPNITTMVGQLYVGDDGRRDAGFSIYYLGINTGAFFAPLVCGFLAQFEGFRTFLETRGIDPRQSWHFAFGAAAIGMFFGLVQYVWGGLLLGDAGRRKQRSPEPLQATRQKRILALAVLAITALALLLVLSHSSGFMEVTVERLNAALGIALLLVPMVFFATLLMARGFTVEEKKRLAVVAILFVFSSLFFGALEQGSGTLNLFAARNTRNEVFGFVFPSTWFQFINPIFILVLTPGFAWLWVVWGRRQPSSPAKFSIALSIIGMGYLIITYAARSSAVTDSPVSPYWLLALYFFNTVAELFISPVGLSMVTKLAPRRATSQVMGVWFIANAIGNFLAGESVVLSSVFSQATIFGAIAAICLIAGCVLGLIVQPIRRLMVGVS